MIKHLGISIAAFASFVGCVSVSMPTGGGKKADGVRFEAPRAPFRDLAGTGDRAWVNDRTGNTISFISECEAKGDPTLQQMQNEAVNSLEDPRVAGEKSRVLDGRPARSALVTGSIDGVPVSMHVVTLKKNSCNYTFAQTGVPAKFDADADAFEAFLQGFRAP